MCKQQQVLSRVGSGVGLVGCTPLVVGLHSCSLCGVLSWYAKPLGHTSGSSGGGSLLPQPSPNQCHASHLRCVLPLLSAGHSLRSRPFCVPLDDGPMSSLFVQCIPFRSCRTESDTLSLPAVVGVCNSLSVPKSDRGCGEVKNRCTPPRGVGPSVLIVSDTSRTYGRTTLALGVPDTSGWWGRALGSQFLVTNSLGYPFILNTL